MHLRELRMRTLHSIPLMVTLLGSCSCFAQDVKSCDSALAPSIEMSTRDYALAQSYMYVNASYEYEKLKKSSAESRAASGTYKLFSAEYNDSKNADEFQKKVHDRLKEEGFSMKETEARSSYKRHLSDKQLDVWAACVQAISKGGALFLGADSVSSSGFPLRVRWFPQAGVGSGMLIVRIKNAKINGLNEVQARLEGASARAFIVEPDISDKQIVITAEIAGAANDITLPRSFPVAGPSPARLQKSTPAARTTIVVPASEFVRPVNVALGGPPNANYGADVLLNAPPYPARPNAAEFEFSTIRGGDYQLKIEYASLSPRPAKILLNGEIAIENAMAASTGCWEVTCQSLLNQGQVKLKDGRNVMRVERGDVFPHIRKFVFVPLE